MRHCIILLLLLSANVFAGDEPDCSGVDNYPTQMALTLLENRWVIEHDKMDFKRTETLLINSQKIGDDRYRQVFKMTFYQRDKKEPIQIISVNELNSEECGFGAREIEIYLISKKL